MCISTHTHRYIPMYHYNEHYFCMQTKEMYIQTKEMYIQHMCTSTHTHRYIRVYHCNEHSFCMQTKEMYVQTKQMYIQTKEGKMHLKKCTCTRNQRHCNTLEHAATHCSTHCNTHCNTPCTCASFLRQCSLDPLMLRARTHAHKRT